MLDEQDQATTIELALFLCHDQVFDGDFASLSSSMLRELQSLGYDLVEKEPTDAKD